MNRKVKIITRHFICNYGSILQSIASLEFFKKNFSLDTEIIDYIPTIENAWHNVKSISKKKKGIKRILFILLRFPDYLISNIVFSSFRKNIKMTKRFKSLKELQQHDFKNDILVSGSDQLFGKNVARNIDYSYYLDFGNNNNLFIAFSSSFGKYNFNQQEEHNIKNLLQKYDLISVRESSAKEYLLRLGVKSDTILDPTLMIDKNFWYSYCDKVKNNKSKYILVYNLHTNLLLEKTAKYLSKKHNLKIIRVSQYFSALRLKGKKKIMVRPEKFVALFRDATFIITDSFHGTVFSTIFEKEFLDITPGATSARITDFLNTLNIKNRYISSESEINMFDFNKKIDYSIVNKNLDEIKKNNINSFTCEFNRIIKEK